ncbi:hypothetical protein D3C80_1007090 [compost metagenome]
MAGLQIGNAGGVVGHVQRAFIAGLAVDAVAFDHGEDFGRRLAQYFVQTAALLFAESHLDVVGANPGAGIDQPDVAPRATVAKLPGFQHHHALALFQQVDRRGQAGDATTDNADIRLDIAGQCDGGRRCWRHVFPQTFLTQFGHGLLAPCFCLLLRRRVHRGQARSYIKPL